MNDEIATAAIAAAVAQHLKGKKKNTFTAERNITPASLKVWLQTILEKFFFVGFVIQSFVVVNFINFFLFIILFGELKFQH